MDSRSRVPIRVLATDDDEQVLALYDMILTAEGCEVFSARSGNECMRLARKHRPDVILLDINMPGPSGYNTAAALSGDDETSSIPIIIVTGMDSSEERVRGLKAGAVDFVSKPVDATVLMAKVSALARLKVYNDEMKRRQAALRSELAGQGERLQATLEVFSRFVPQEFLKALGKPDVASVRLGDQEQVDTAILFSDIRNFTALSEKMSPEQNFGFLNSYLSRMNPFVWENGGFIDKYIGDAIMALFPRGAGSAVAAAVAMLGHLPVYNGHRARFGYDPLRIGIGVHSGSVMLGIIGHERFMQGTAISSAVNLASRLESLTKIYGVSLLVSSSAFGDIDDPSRYSYRFIDKVKVKGKDEAVSVYEVFDGDEAALKACKLETRERFERGVYDFHGGRFAEAQERFREILRADPIDTPVEIYLRRCTRALKFGEVPEESAG
jgi:class 3 adenylate cyclase